MFGYLENDWWEMRRTVTGAKGRRSVAGAEEGEVSPMWRNQSVASAEEGEASPMQRNRSVADSKNPKCRCSDHCESFVSAMVISDVTDSEKSKCRWCSNHCESFISATVQVLSVMVISDVTDLEKSKRPRCLNRCELFYRRRFKFYRWLLSATSSIRRNRSIANAQIVANRSYRRRFRFYRRRHWFEEIEVSPMLKSLWIVRIGDGSSGLSTTK